MIRLACLAVFAGLAAATSATSATAGLTSSQMSADRLFVGGAVPAGGAAQPTWVGTMANGVFAYLERIGTSLSYAPPGLGTVAQLAAARTSDSGEAGCCTIPLGTLLFNDNTSTPQFGWGSYHTAVRAPGAGGVVNTEWNVGNLGSLEPVNVFGLSSNMTIDLWVACGGEISKTDQAAALNPCSAAMYVLDNGQTFDKGIAIGANALSRHNGLAYAINLPSNDMIRWSSSDTDVSDTFIYSSVNNDQYANGLLFTNFGAQFQDLSGNIQAVVALVPSATSFPQLNASNSGNVVYQARNLAGGDVSLSLAPQDSGRVISTGPFQLPAMTVAQFVNTYGTCSAANEGLMTAITDADSATFNAPLAGGGSNHIIGYCDGTRYVVH